ncbi:TRAF3-interacting JNK-activating modulator [Grus japonensis]|uniref:TRAF3-interacting JNK-activating modulator n=1 Tax=Grus japonensis TaxID=30415 RepID=A0ABC9XRJ3_GRUJA
MGRSQTGRAASNMISQPEKARPQYRRANESYDEKCERRHETRENLRRRNNMTTCRRSGRGAEEPSQSPRQREFLRRRNLASDAGSTPLGREPEARVPLDPSSPVEPRSPVLLQGQLNEDKLKCKLRALENQLQACTQSYSKECVKKILIEMEDQKQTYEQKAKEALQKMLEDKLQTEQQLQNSQRSLAATREDLTFWKEHYTTLKEEMTKLTAAHTELENSFHVLQSKLQQADMQNEQLQQALCSLQNEHATLHRRASALREDNDLKAEHISAIEDQVFTTQTPPLTPAKEKQNTLLEHPEEEGEESLKEEMQKRTSQLTAKENECTELRSELEALSEEYRSCLTRLRQCRDELNHFQGKQAKRQRSHWVPLLVAVIAMAIATFLTSYRP